MLANDDSWKISVGIQNGQCLHCIYHYDPKDVMADETWHSLMDGTIFDGMKQLCIYCEFARLQTEGHDDFTFLRLQQLFFAVKEKCEHIKESYPGHWSKAIQQLYEDEIRDIDSAWIKPAKVRP